MQVTIELPESLALLLAADGAGISRAVLEAVLVTAVRDALVSPAQARQVLGLSRYEMDGLLKQHHAGVDLSISEMEQDTENALAFVMK